MTAQAIPPKILLVIKIADEDFGVSPEAILSGSKIGETSRARRMAIQSLRRMGYSLTQIGRWLGCHHTSCLYALKRPVPVPMGHTRGSIEIPVPDLSGEWAI